MLSFLGRAPTGGVRVNTAFETPHMALDNETFSLLLDSVQRFVRSEAADTRVKRGR